MVEALVPEPPATLSIADHRQAIADAAVFVREQVGALAIELRWLLLIGLAAFRVVIWLQHRRRFRDLNMSVRRETLMHWACGSVSLTRQLFRPIRSTALVAYYEYIAVAQQRRPA